MLNVSGAFVGVIGDWLKSIGYGASSLSYRIKLMKPDQLLTIDSIEALLEEAVALSGNDYAPLAIGQMIEKKHLASIWHMLATARTLEEMLNAYVFYESVFYGANIANVRRNGDGLELYWTVTDAPRHYCCLALSAFVSIKRLMGVPANAIASVSFPFDDVVNVDDYHKGLGCSSVFFRRELSIQFRSEALNFALKLREEDASKESIVRDLMPTLTDVDFAVRLYDEIASALPQQQASLKTLAKNMMVSERTLQRRLSTVDDGLRGCIVKIRMHLAQRYLMDIGMSLAAVSLMLGYSEQSSFQLAFKRFYGVTPGQWRKEHL